MTTAELVKWVGTGILLMGITLNAINIYPLNIIVILIATSCLMYVARVQKDKQYSIINGVILAINSIALLVYYL